MLVLTASAISLFLNITGAGTRGTRAKYATDIAFCSTAKLFEDLKILKISRENWLRVYLIH